MESVLTAPLDELQTALRDARTRGSAVAFQSTLAAASGAVAGSFDRLVKAEKSALSLAQQEHLAELREELGSALSDLQEAITPSGQALMGVSLRRKWRLGMRWMPYKSDPAGEKPRWPDSIKDAIVTLRDAADRMRCLGSGQADGAPARALAEATAWLLDDHHQRLVDRSGNWLP